MPASATPASSPPPLRRAVAIPALLTLLLLFVAGFAPARAQADPAPRLPWVIDDYVTQPRDGGFVMSPDGRHVAWTRTTADIGEDRFRTALRLAALDTPDFVTTTLFDAAKGAGSPRFSPDGKHLAWLSGHEAPKGAGGRQIWTLKLDEGATTARRISSVQGGVRGFRWLPGGRLLIAARQAESYAELQAKAEKDRAIVIEEQAAYDRGSVRLFVLSAKGGKLQPVSDETGRVGSFAPSPDGRHVIYTIAIDPIAPVDARNPSRVFLRRLPASGQAEAKAGSARELFTERRSRPGRFVWSADSQRIYAVTPRASVDGEDLAAVLELSTIDPESGATADLPLGWQRGLDGRGNTLVALSEGFLARLRDGLEDRMALFTPSRLGHERVFLEGEHVDQIDDLAGHHGTDRVVYTISSAEEAPRTFVATRKGRALTEPRELVGRGSSWKRRQTTKVTRLRWTGAEGATIEGLLYHPNDGGGERARPLVVMPHGGPHSADRDRWNDRWAYAMQLHAERGAYCLMVNYQGSEGFGLAFGEAIKNRYYELELVDILSGVKLLVDSGRVDRDKMGLYGWSNGAILSTALLTLADRYAPDFDYDWKICVPGAGNVNWTSDYGNCAFGVQFDDFYLGGPPWRESATYVEKSPLFHAEKVTAPTLILFGDQDRAVPTEQGWQWYRALQQIGRAPVRYVLFPDQGHGMSRPSTQRRKLAEELAWFDRYFYGTFESLAPAAASPLAAAKTPNAALATEAQAALERLTQRVLGQREALAAPSSELAARLVRASCAQVSGLYGERLEGRLVPELVACDGLWVARFEVTRAQYAALSDGPPLAAGTGNLPRTGVSFAAAKAWTEKLAAATGIAFRLPTAAEWSRLPKGPDATTLSGLVGRKLNPADAKAIADVARSLPGPAGAPPLVRPVGQARPGLWTHGEHRAWLFDLEGNAAEWVVGPDGEGQLMGPSALTLSSPHTADAKPLPAYAGFRVVVGPLD